MAVQYGLIVLTATVHKVACIPDDMLCGYKCFALYVIQKGLIFMSTNSIDVSCAVDCEDCGGQQRSLGEDTKRKDSCTWLECNKHESGHRLDRSPKLLICILICCIICLLGGWLLLISAEASSEAREEIQAELSGALLRLHIVANSDSEADQAVKLEIRDAITDAFGEQFLNAGDKNAACALAETLLPEAEALANQVLQEQGFSETATASLTFCYFPEKTYGDMTFPAGYYDALRITIGAARGQNWWCVLYPPLCFTEVSTSMPESSKELLQNNLSVRAYESLMPECAGIDAEAQASECNADTDSSFQNDTPDSDKEKTGDHAPVIRFRFLTFLNDLFS